MHMVPGHLIPKNWSSFNWSSFNWSRWTNGSQPIQSPNNLVPLDKWSLEYSVFPERQAVGMQKYEDQIGWGPFVHGDRILWGPFVQGDQFHGDCSSRGINFMGIVCPGEQEVGERKSWDQIGSGLNAAQKIGSNLVALLRINVHVVLRIFSKPNIKIPKL